MIMQPECEQRVGARDVLGSVFVGGDPADLVVTQRQIERNRTLTFAVLGIVVAVMTVATTIFFYTR